MPVVPATGVDSPLVTEVLVSPSRFSSVVPCALVAALAGSISVGEAGVVQYTEILEDENDFPFLLFDLARDLRRERTLGTGQGFLETDDAVIDAENLVSPSFGVTSTDPIAYSHIFIADPAVLAFQTLTLTIDAFSVSGSVDPNVDPVEQVIQFLLGFGTVPDDLVTVDGVIVGNLVPGGPFVETVFQTSTGNELLIALALLDHRLDMTIVPAGPGALGIPDQIAIRRSELAVTYLVPEPVTVTVLAFGLLSVAAVRWRARP
jgi:hypothetical protein